MNADPSQQPNTLGNASLVLGILGISLVFGIGLCALVGMQQGWLQVGGSVLFVCGASSAFLGLLAGILGLAGLFGKNRPRAAAIAGLLLGLGGVCLFLGLLNAVAK
jgi:cytochrome c biogenesis protein CcdA